MSGVKRIILLNLVPTVMNVYTMLVTLGNVGEISSAPVQYSTLAFFLLAAVSQLGCVIDKRDGVL